MNPSRLFNLTKASLSWFGFLCASLAAFVVLANNVNGLSHHQFFISSFYLLIAFNLAFLSGSVGLVTIIFLLPLSPALHHQLNAFFGLSIQAQANPGIDLVAGFFLGLLSKQIAQELMRRKLQIKQSNIENLGVPGNLLTPWPIGLALFVISISTVLAISRNAWQSAARISFDGILFNFEHFRPLAWHDDFMPLTDWIAFALAGAMAIIVIVKLKECARNKSVHCDQIIFLPLICGVALAAILGLIQSRTGIGLPEAALEFRKDRIGFAALGFQPDIHAYAGHMLLGACGLWGYWYACFKRGASSPWHMRLIGLTIALAWLGLIVSKSRFSLIIAFVFMMSLVLIYLWRQHRKWFYWVSIGIAVCGLFLFQLFFTYRNQSSFWVIHLIAQLYEQGFSSIAAVGGIFGDRPEIFAAAARMFTAFPLMGIGQGDFFRMSANAAFSQSSLLSVRGGENAHNYFLQTLTENGLIGSASLVFALLAPFLFIRKASVLIPAGVGLTGILLGNIYAHSLLIRENLLLAAVLVGLMYYWLSVEGELNGRFSATSNVNVLPNNPLTQVWNMKSVTLALSFLLVFFMGALEAVRSFQGFPFQYGSLCFVPKPITSDGWSSGTTMAYRLPEGTHGMRLPLELTRPDLLRYPLGAHLQIMGPGWQVLAKTEKRWNLLGPTSIEVGLPNNQISDGSIDVELHLSSCFTPRNLGVNIDGRRLGVLVGTPEFF